MHLDLTRSVADVSVAEALEVDWSPLMPLSERAHASAKVEKAEARLGCVSPSIDRREAVIIGLGLSCATVAITVYWVIGAVLTIETVWARLFYMGVR